MFNQITQILSSRLLTQKSSQTGKVSFKPGDVFRGTVVQKQSPGRYLIAARGRRFLANTEINMVEGSRHRFQIKTVEPKVLLKILDSGKSTPDSALKIWTSTRPIREKMGHILTTLAGTKDFKGLSETSREGLRFLNQQLPAFVYDKPDRNGALWLTRSLMDSGLFLENKLAQVLLDGKGHSLKTVLNADLKGLLLQLVKHLKADAGRHEHLGPLVQSAEQALHLIEQDQFLNLSSIREDLGWFWFIPGREQEGFRRAEAFIKRGKSEGDVAFSLFMDFTHLGQIEAHVSLTESVLGIRMLAQQASTAELINEHLSLLTTNLQGAGMVLGAVTCEQDETVNAEDTPFTEEKGEYPAVDMII